MRKAPEGYIYNSRMCLIGWEWAKKQCFKQDNELATKYKLDSTKDPQKDFLEFAKAYQWEHGQECKADLRDD